MILFNPACTLAPIAGWQPAGVRPGKLSVKRFGVEAVNRTETRTLATLRDPDKSGLPKLLSGELSVAGTELLK